MPVFAPRISKFGFFALSLLGSLMLTAAGSAQVGPPVRPFQEGNQRYEDGDYAGALDAYRQAVRSGHESGALYFNMGNAYYRRGELGQARRYYERARRLMPDNPRLLHNIEQVQRRTADSFTARPDPLWTRWWRAAHRYIAPSGFFLAGMIGYLIGIGLIGYRLLSGRIRSWQRGVIGGALIGGGLLLGAAFAASMTPSPPRRAVVVAKAVPLYSSPAAQDSSDQTLHEGLLLNVLHTDSSWMQVELPNGKRGWLKADSLASI